MLQQRSIHSFLARTQRPSAFLLDILHLRLQPLVPTAEPSYALPFLLDRRKCMSLLGRLSFPQFQESLKQCMLIDLLRLPRRDGKTTPTKHPCYLGLRRSDRLVWLATVITSAAILFDADLGGCWPTVSKTFRN